MRNAKWIVLAILWGCSKHHNTTRDAADGERAKPKPTPLAPAPTVTWAKFSTDAKLVGRGVPAGAELRVYDESNGLRVHPVKLPIGTKIRSQALIYEIRKEFSEGVVVPFGEHFADIAWAVVKPFKPVPQVDTDVSFTVEMPNTEPLKVTVPPRSVSNAVRFVFSEMAKGGPGWPGEAPAREVPPAAAWTINGLEGLGTAPRLRDVRFVVTGELKANGSTRRCTGYAGARDFTASAHDVELKIIDVVAKRAVAEKKFVGHAACPRWVVRTAESGPSHSEGPDGPTMTRWVTAQLPMLARAASKL